MINLAKCLGKVSINYISLCIYFEGMKDYIFYYGQIITSRSFMDKTKLVC